MIACNSNSFVGWVRSLLASAISCSAVLGPGSAQLPHAFPPYLITPGRISFPIRTNLNPIDSWRTCNYRRGFRASFSLSVIEVGELTAVRLEQLESDIDASLIDHDPKKLFGSDRDFVKVRLHRLQVCARSIFRARAELCPPDLM